MKELGVYTSVINRKVPDGSGSTVIDKTVVFKFWSDEITSDRVHTAFPKMKKYSGDARALYVELPMKIAQQFIGGKFWGNLMKMYEESGYVLNETLDEVRSKLEFADRQTITDDDKRKAVNDLNKYIDDIINGLETDYNDPRFKSLMSNITIMAGGDAFEQLEKVRPSVKNVILMLTQWRNAGRSGHPTFVTTKGIWERIFQREVLPSAVKLLVSRPSNTTRQSMSDAMQQLGITNRDDLRNAGVRFTVDKFAGDRNFGMLGANNPGSEFHPIIYYDVSDTRLLSYANGDPFIDLNGASNIDNNGAQEPDSAFRQSDDQNAEAQVEIENNTENEKTVYDGIVRYANRSNDNVIKNMIKNKSDLFSLLRALVNEESNIDLKKDGREKEMLINTVLFALCRYYGIFDDKIGTLYNNGVRFIGKEGKVDRKKFYGVMPNVYNIIDKIGNVNVTEGMSLVDISKMLFEDKGGLAFVSEEFKDILNRIVLAD